LADLNLSIDGQCTSDEALRDLAETVSGGRWLALGAAGTARSGWHPERWTHQPAILSGHDSDPAAPLPQAGAAGTRRQPRHLAADRHVRRHNTSRAVAALGRLTQPISAMHRRPSG